MSEQSDRFIHRTEEMLERIAIEDERMFSGDLTTIKQGIELHNSLRFLQVLIDSDVIGYGEEEEPEEE